MCVAVHEVFSLREIALGEAHIRVDPAVRYAMRATAPTGEKGDSGFPQFGLIDQSTIGRAKQVATDRGLSKNVGHRRDGIT
jgi:hypothetical protein